MSYRDFTKRLTILGFVLQRQGKGSHELWYHPHHKYIFTVPHHAGKSMSIGVVKSFLRMMKMTIKDFHSLVKK